MNAPESLSVLLTKGMEELQEDRKRHNELVAFHLKNREREELSGWDAVCAEIKNCLGEKICALADLKKPYDWNPGCERHWFYLTIPGLSTIVVQFKRAGREWYLDRYGVRCFDGGISFWCVFGREEKTIQYLLALAREQYINDKNYFSEEIDHQAVS